MMKVTHFTVLEKNRYCCLLLTFVFAHLPKIRLSLILVWSRNKPTLSRFSSSTSNSNCHLPPTSLPTPPKSTSWFLYFTNRTSISPQFQGQNELSPNYSFQWGCNSVITKTSSYFSLSLSYTISYTPSTPKQFHLLILILNSVVLCYLTSPPLHFPSFCLMNSTQICEGSPPPIHMIQWVPLAKNSDFPNWFSTVTCMYVIQAGA